MAGLVNIRARRSAGEGNYGGRRGAARSNTDPNAAGAFAKFRVCTAQQVQQTNPDQEVPPVGEVEGSELVDRLSDAGEVIKAKRIGWPRGESDGHIFTVGNARPLDQAAQHATSEMLRWLQHDYGLDERGAHFLLGTRIQYDVGNFFDPAYTMVCKLARDALPARA